MSKRPLQEKKQIKSKYFSLESYFKPSDSTDNETRITDKKPKICQEDAFDNEIEKAIKLSLITQEDVVTVDPETTTIKQEYCPLCNLAIITSSMSLEVHVNQCLDMQQLKQKEGNSGKLLETRDLDDIQNDTLENQVKKNKEIEKDEEGEKEEEEEEFSIKDEDLIEGLIYLEQYGIKNEELCEKTELLQEEQVNVASLSLREKFSFKGSTGSSSSILNSNETSRESSFSTNSSLEISSWRSKFSSTNGKGDVGTGTNNRIKAITPILDTKKKKQKPCPFYKRMKDTRFTVDAFNYGKIPDCDGYFLTHFHSDHYGGLRSNWDNGPIYCSKITANLVKQELRVNSKFVYALPMNELYPIPNSNVSVALIDANHCPGSVLFLFVIKKNDGTVVRHLHTGDFRASPRMCLHPLLRQPENGAIHNLYLDTTYLSPEYSFPAQEECINAVCKAVEENMISFDEKEKKKSPGLEKWLQPTKTNEENAGSEKIDTDDKKEGIVKSEGIGLNNIFGMLMGRKTSNKPRILIVVGTYTIGKERVFINIARKLKCKVFAPARKRRILLCQEDEELKNMITSNPLEAQVHVVPLRDIRGDIMHKYLEEHKTHFDKLIGFKPTGWTFKSSKAQTTEMKLGPLSQITLPPTDRTLLLEPHYRNDKIKIYGVPYSEHSSFRELASFVASLDVKKTIPTVNIGKLDAMSVFFNNWEEEKASKRIEIIPYPSEDYW